MAVCAGAVARQRHAPKHKNKEGRVQDLGRVEEEEGITASPPKTTTKPHLMNKASVRARHGAWVG